MHQKPLESTREHYSPFLQEQTDLHKVLKVGLQVGLWGVPMSQGARVGTLLQNTL